MPVKAKILYDELIAAGYKFSSANASEFYNNMKADPQKAALLYDEIKADGKIQLASATADEFVTGLGLKKKDGTASSSVGAPTDSTGAKVPVIATSVSDVSEPDVSKPREKVQPYIVQPIDTSIPSPDERYMRRNPFFNTSMDRPDLAAIQKEAKVSADVKAADDQTQVTSFLKNPTIGKLEEGDRKTLLDRVSDDKRVKEQLAGTYDGQSEAKLQQERKDFSTRFYNAELTGDDIAAIKSLNPLTTPQEETGGVPDSLVAESINNKTKFLRDSSIAAVQAGAEKYLETLDSIDKAISEKTSTAASALLGNDLEAKTKYLSSQEQVKQDIETLEERKRFLRREYYENQYKPEEDKLFNEDFLSILRDAYAGFSIEQIYKRSGGKRAADADTPSESEADSRGLDAAIAKRLHDDPAFNAKLKEVIKYDEYNHLTKESVKWIRETITNLVNKEDNPIIDAWEHGSRGRNVVTSGQETNLTGDASFTGSTPGVATTRRLPTDPNELIKRAINYFEFELPAKVMTQGYVAKFKNTDDGKVVSPIIDNQTKILNHFASDKVKDYEAGLKVSLDSNYIAINNRVGKQLESNPVYVELQTKWKGKVDQSLVTPELAYKNMLAEAANDPALKKIFESREKEISIARDGANKQREKFIITGLSQIDNNLEIDEKGNLTVKGVPREEVLRIINTYQKGYESELKSKLGFQDEQLDLYANAVNEGMKRTFGGFFGGLGAGFKTGVDKLGASVSRWLLHKSGAAGSTLDYFEGENYRSLNRGEFAETHYRYKGLESLLDPAFYGFSVGQSLPYAAPAVIAGVATGGTTLAIVGSGFFGATMETAENQLMTRDDLFTNGVGKDGLKINSQEADKFAAQQFREELLPNILFQTLELGALLRTAKYAKPSLGIAGIAKGVGDVAKAGFFEAAQEGIQGLVQYNITKRAAGEKELDMFDYMQTDDFTQNFFGGFAGGVGMGVSVKPMTYLKSVQNWKGMINESRKAFGEALVNGFTETVPYANALHAEMNGSGAEFRDGIRLRIQNEQYESGAEKENLGRTLKYSQRLKDATVSEGVVPSNINGLYVAHNTAMANLYSELASGNSVNSKVYESKAKDFQAEAVKASNGDAQIYYATDALGRPIFMTQRTANVLGQEQLGQWKQRGFIQNVNAINDDKFNETISSKVNAASAVAPVRTGPVVQQQETTQQLLERNKSKFANLFPAEFITERPDEVMKFVSQQARNVTADEQPYESASQDANQPTRADAMKKARTDFGNELVDRAIEMFPGTGQAATQQAAPTIQYGTTYKSTIEGVNDATPTIKEGEKINLLFEDGTNEQVTEEEFNLMYAQPSAQATVASAVIEIGGQIYEGKNHAEAILKAKADGKNISQVDRQGQGQFKLSDGTTIDRATAKRDFGQDRSEFLITQDEAANQANKDYAKEAKPSTEEVAAGNETSFPVSELNKMPKGELSRTQENQAALSEDIATNGIKEPITLIYYPADNVLRVGNGHHRLSAATQLGLANVPVQVQVEWNKSINDDTDVAGQELYHPPTPLDVEGYKARNYQPTNIKLSELGFKEAQQAGTQSNESVTTEEGSAPAAGTTGAAQETTAAAPVPASKELTDDEAAGIERKKESNAEALRQLADKNKLNFGLVLRDFYNWVKTGVAKFAHLAKEYAKIAVTTIVLATSPNTTQRVNADQTTQTISTDETKTITDLANKYYAVNDEVPPKEVIDRAIYLWKVFGRPAIETDTTGARPFAQNVLNDRVSNIGHLGDFIDELSHIAQFVSGNAPAVRQYTTQEEYDSIEYDRKGSIEYDAHKIIAPILANFIFNGKTGAELINSTSFESDAVAKEVQAALEKYLPDVTAGSIKVKGKELADLLRKGKIKSPGLQSNIAGIPIWLYNTAVETLAKAVQGGATIAQAIQQALAHIKDNHNKPINESAVLHVLENYAKTLSEKPVREGKESMADYAMRVLAWRKKLLNTGTAFQQSEALAGSQSEVDYIKTLNEGIELLRKDITVSPDAFNKTLSLRQGSRDIYVAALKYLKSSNKDAARILGELRKSNPKMIVATEISLLKKQLVDWGRGFRAGAKDAAQKIAAIRGEISTMLKEYNDQELFAGIKYTPKELLRMASYVNNAVTEATLNHFRSMVVKLIEKAEFGRQVNAAKQLQKQVRKILKSKDTITSNDISLLKDLLTLNPLRVSDLGKLIDILQEVAVTRTAKEGARVRTNETMQFFVEEERAFDVKERATEVIEKYFELMDSQAVKELSRAGKVTRMPSDIEFQDYVDAIANPAAAKPYKEQVRELNRLSEILSHLDRDAQDRMSSVDSGALTLDELSPLDYANAVVSVDNPADANDRANNRLVLEEMAKAQQEAIDPDDAEFSDEQKEILSKLKSLDVTGFDSSTLRLFINVLNNVVLNDDMSGSGIFEVKTEARNQNEKEFIDWLDSKEYVVRQKKTRGKAGSTFSDLKKAFTSTEQILWHIANNAASLMVEITGAFQIGKIKRGYTKTVHEHKVKVTDRLNKLFGDGLVQDAVTNIKMTIHSWLSQNKFGTTEENQKEFARRIAEIKRDVAIKEEFGKDADKAEAAIVREVFQELRAAILEHNGIDINGDVFDAMDASVMKGIDWLSEVQDEAYELFREVYDETRPMFEEIMEKYLNKEFIPWANYMPDSFKNLFGGLIDVDINAENFGNSIFARETEGLTDETGAFNVRVEGNRLVEPKPSEDTRVINYNWFHRNTENTKAMMLDINTLKDRQVASEVFKSKKMEEAVGRDNMEILKETLIKELKGMTGMQGKPSARYLRAFKAVSNTLGSIAAKYQLVSFTAFMKQYASAFMNTAAYLGADAGYMSSAMRLIETNDDVKTLIEANEISLRDTTRAGTNIFTERNVAETEQRQTGNDMVKSLQDFSNKINGNNKLTGEEKSFMRYFLVQGDVVSAKTSWVALYGQWLVKNGVYDKFSDIDWAKEAAGTHPKAADYAQAVVSKQLNVNSRNAFGEVYQDPNAAVAILKGLFGLFGNFGFNKTVAIWNNISTLRSDASVVSDEQRKEEKEFAMRSLASGLVEELMFQFVKGVFVKLTIVPLILGLGKIFGGDEEDEVLGKMQKKSLDTAFRGYLGNVVSNYFFSFAGSGQVKINEGMNNLLSMVGVKDDFFFEASSNPNYDDRTGLFNASGVKSLWDDAARLSKLLFERTDRFGGKVDTPKGIEYRLATLALIADVGQMLKFNDADINRLIQKRMRVLDVELDKRYKEPYWRDAAEDAAMRDNLSIGGVNRELTEAQQRYYYQKRQERMSQIKDYNATDEKKSQVASEYAKQALVAKYTAAGLKVALPKEKKK